VSFEYSHGYGTSCSNKTLAPRGCNHVGLAGCKLHELFHRIVYYEHFVIRRFSSYSFLFGCSHIDQLSMELVCRQLLQDKLQSNENYNLTMV
jgi:hypothetical protein